LHRPVAELETTLTHREFTDWLRFEATVSPLPDKLADLHNAIVCSLIVNAVRSADSPPARPADFLIINEIRAALPDDGMSEVERAMLAWRGGS
jgi:hypothetical protein